MLPPLKSSRSWRKSDVEKADKLARSVTIHDRLLYVEAEQDGKILYTGAFAHWFESNQKENKGEKSEKASVSEIARLIGKF